MYTLHSIYYEFEFNKDLLNDKEFEPIIYYFNEDKQELEALKTTIEGNVAIAKTTHFSKYILINRKVYEDSFTWQDEWSTTPYSSVEIVLAIDDSSSMADQWRLFYTIKGNDPNYKRLDVAKKLIDKLPENSKIGVLKFEDDATSLTSGLTTDTELAKSYLTKKYFKSSGLTYMYEGINKGISMFSNTNDESILKMMVVISDGEATDVESHKKTISEAVAAGVKIYTVGLGSSATSYFKDYLKPLASNTGGGFYMAANADGLADIYDKINRKIEMEADSDRDGIADFYEENMVMFNGVVIKSDKNNPDTDGDGVPDGEEVAEIKYHYNEDKTKVIVTGKLLSDPIKPDSDFDGRNDNVDAAPLNNNFTGKLKSNYGGKTIKSNVKFNMDFRWFYGNNTVYNKQLSKTSLLFASEVYHTTSLSINDSVNIGMTEGISMENVLRYFGFKDAKTVKLSDIYNDNHLSEVGLGYREVIYDGKKKNVIAVIVRGTDSTINEWASNFYIGEKGQFDSFSDWKTIDNHAGFDIASNRIMNIVNQYVEQNDLMQIDCAYWITGHSRGAAIANIIGAYYEDEGRETYTYTYAAPNTTMAKNVKEYDTIFNVINSDDFVPCLPMSTWGYSRYGKTASSSIADSYEKTWEKLTGKFDYNPDTYGMDTTIKELGDIIPTGDAREEAYKYTCSCVGGDAKNITITNRGMSKKSRENAIAKIPSNALPYCIINRYQGTTIFGAEFGWGWDFTVCQTPTYFMQILAAQMAGTINVYRFVVELNIADRYEKAKTAIIRSAIGGLEHPHYTESYYVLSDNISGDSFK